MAVFPTDEVQQYILAGESFTIEFKGEERGALSDTDLVEAVVCLANGAGGVLLVGKVILPGGEPDLTFVQRLLAAEKAGPPLTIEDLLVCRAAREQGGVSVDEAARLIQRSASAARAVLERLADRGLLQPLGAAAGAAASYRWRP